MLLLVGVEVVGVGVGVCEEVVILELIQKKMRTLELKESARSRLAYTREFLQPELHLISLSRNLFNQFLQVSMVLAPTT